MNTIEHHHAPPRTDNKLTLMRDTMNAATRLQLSTTAQALLAHILIDTWPRDDGWTADTPQSTLATRMGVSIETVRRAIDELHPLIDYRPGQGGRRSRLIVRANPSPTRGPNARQVPTPARGPSPHPRGEVPSPVRGSTPHPRGDIPGQAIPGAAAGAAEAAAAAAAETRSQQAAQPGQPPPEVLRARVSFLTARPDWLREGQPWIDRHAALELATLELSQADVDSTITDARRSRNTLTNPAGFVVKRLRRLAHSQDAHQLPRSQDAHTTGGAA